MAQRIGAEVLGSFALTFIAAGADASATISAGEVGQLARAIAPGLVVMALIYAIGDRSGAHFNPVVTLAFTLRGLFPRAWVAPYWFAQLAGALAAGTVLVALLGDAASAGVSAPHIGPLPAVAIEAVLTALLVIVILGTADKYALIGPTAAIPVGATIALCGLAAGPVAGASLNPVRSLGPALATLDLGNVWIYIVGPVIGSIAAVLITHGLRGPAPPDDKPREAAEGEH
jgi:aquaporin Z